MVENKEKELKIIASDKAPAAIGPYSQAIVVNGLLFCSGCIGTSVNKDLPKLGKDVETQAKQALKNLKFIVDEAGSAMDKVIKCTVYLRTMKDYGKVNAIYAEAFGDHCPARVCVEVSGLPLDALVEIDAIAKV